MTAVREFLEAIAPVPSVSGHEGVLGALIVEKWRPLVDQISTSRRGSIHALKHGSGPHPRRSLMVAAHMDSVGLQVVGFDHSFLRVSAVGTLDPRILPGTPVTVHGLVDLPGVVAPRARSKALDQTAAASLADVLVDTGLTSVQVRRRVRIGDPISFSSDLVALAGDWFSGRALDNRASLAALTLCLGELAGARTEVDLWTVATTGEEVNLAGAATSAATLKPDIAIAVDTTFGKGPGSDGWQTFEVGGGPTVATGPNLHPALHRRFREVAEELGIPYAVEPVPVSSDTDAMAFQVSGPGIPTMLVEIPIRYMHTAVEVAALEDIEAVGRLLAGFVSSVDQQFIEGLSWET